MSGGTLITELRAQTALLETIAGSTGGSGGTGSSVQVTASVLPTGAATAAKQPALGVAGTPSADVITVQGASGGTPQPVSGTVAVSTSGLPTGASTEVTLASVKTAVEALAALITGGALKAVLQAGTAAYGKLSANDGVDIGNVDVASSALPTGAATETTQGSVKTAVEALAALITGGSLKAVLTAGTAAFGKLSANTAATYIGDVVLAAGTAAIGKLTANSGVNIGAVESVLGSSPFQDTDTNVTAGTRRTLASHTGYGLGFYVTNTHATATVFVGVAATVSSSAYIHRLAPGQSTPLIPLSNSNLLGWDSSVSGGTITYGGY